MVKKLVLKGFGGQAGALFFEILMGSAVAKAMAGQARLRQSYGTARRACD
jgi:hypothetical protein